MHEVSLVQEVIRITEQTARLEGLSKVTLIKLMIGDRFCVMPESLEMAFQWMKQGALLEHAELSWEHCPGRDFYISFIEGD